MRTGSHMPAAVHSRIPGTDFQYGSRLNSGFRKATGPAWENGGRRRGL